MTIISTIEEYQSFIKGKVSKIMSVEVLGSGMARGSRDTKDYFYENLTLWSTRKPKELTVEALERVKVEYPGFSNFKIRVNWKEDSVWKSMLKAKRETGSIWG